MMDLSKSFEFFNPDKCAKTRIHIIGCGSVGSSLAVCLARLGLTNISLYDFDVVEAHNLANQMFTTEDIGKPKTTAVAEMLHKINPDIDAELKIFDKGYDKQRLSGYVFLCVDSIELRRRIVKENATNMNIKAVFDFRTRLTDAQHYAANWSDPKMQDNLLRSMEFTEEEARAATPVSACNVSLSVAGTIWTIVSFGVSNFVNFVNKGVLKKIILVDAFNFAIDTY